MRQDGPSRSQDAVPVWAARPGLDALQHRRDRVVALGTGVQVGSQATFTCRRSPLADDGVSPMASRRGVFVLPIDVRDARLARISLTANDDVVERAIRTSPLRSGKLAA
jgi:hypothetical protein